MNTATLRLPVRAELGEGLHWDEGRQCLWMVDIHGRRLIACDLERDTWQEWAMPQRIGWVIPLRDSDELLAGFQEGVARLQLDGPQVRWTWHARLDHAPAMRMNDAKADASGAIWAGTMNNEDVSGADGRLLRIAPSGEVTVADTGYHIPNGPAIHPDGRLFLHTDSALRTIFAYDLVGERVLNRRVWARFGEVDGYPDGMNFDAEGCLWVAHWGIGEVRRYGADARLLERHAVPASQTSNLCFAGADRDRVVVTTARVGLGTTLLDAEANAGDLFEIAGAARQGAAAARAAGGSA